MLSFSTSSFAHIGSESIENDIIIDDEGISDIGKMNGIVINPSKANEHALTYPTTKFIQKYVPNARLLEQIGQEIIYVLPTEDKVVVKKFENLFTELDRYYLTFDFSSSSVTRPTLTIFLELPNPQHDVLELLKKISRSPDFAALQL